MVIKFIPYHKFMYKCNSSIMVSPNNIFGGNWILSKCLPGRCGKFVFNMPLEDMIFFWGRGGVGVTENLRYHQGLELNFEPEKHFFLQISNSFSAFQFYQTYSFDFRFRNNATCTHNVEFYIKGV